LKIDEDEEEDGKKMKKHKIKLGVDDPLLNSIDLLNQAVLYLKNK